MTTSVPSSGRPDEDQWWYCLKHGTVERGTDCRAADRMGPYPDQAAAQRALETASERSASWDEDPDWKND